MGKIMIILISLLTAFAIMSSGYGKWSQELYVKVDIEVEGDSESQGDQLYGEEQGLILVGEQGLLEEQEASKGEADNTNLEQSKEEGANEEAIEEPNHVIDIAKPLESVSIETNSTDEGQIEEISVETSNNEDSSSVEGDNQE